MLTTTFLLSVISFASAALSFAVVPYNPGSAFDKLMGVIAVVSWIVMMLTGVAIVTFGVWVVVSGGY